MAALSLLVLSASCGNPHERAAPDAKRAREAEQGEVRIAFKRRCHDYGECDRVGNGIYGLRRRRPRLVRLTSEPSDRDPAWSPDGMRLAFARCEGGDCDLWTFDLATSKEARVTTGPPFDGEPTWSPDGTRLAFHRCAPGGEARNSCEIWAIAIDGTSAQRLTSNDVADGHPDWSWRFDEIVFDRGDCPSGTTSCRRSAIFVMAADGTGARRLAGPRSGAWEPRWDRTRRRIAYDACHGFCRDVDERPGSPLVVQDLRDGRRVVRSRWELVFSPTFSRLGRRLMFAVLSGDDGAVMDRRLNGRREHTFYSDYEFNAFAPDWRPRSAPSRRSP